MATKHFGLSTPDQRWQQRQNALLFGEAGCFSREGVMEELQDLFRLCYRYGINPLPSLRKVFPVMDWEYWKQEGMDWIGAVIENALQKNADFVWPLSSIEVVSASRRDGRVNPDYVFFFDRSSSRSVGNLGRMARSNFNVKRIVG